MHSTFEVVHSLWNSTKEQIDVSGFLHGKNHKGEKEKQVRVVQEIKGVQKRGRAKGIRLYFTYLFFYLKKVGERGLPRTKRERKRK